MSGGREVLFCADSGNCADTHFNLGPEGRWSHCGRAADWGLLDYGAIHDRSIAEVFADPQRDELRRRNEILSREGCEGCGCWAVCHGGCPLDGYLNTGSLMGKSTWCLGKKDFVERYFTPITGITPTVAPAPRTCPTGMASRKKRGIGDDSPLDHHPDVAR
jgi:radical SAM protein with 4Fe4S-binding SPASM domain